MIKVNYKKNDYITIKGHAMYADLGKDIVCASASSIVITSINAMLSIDNNSLEVIKEKGYIKATLKIQDDNMLEELSHDYPKNITVRNEEEKWNF